MEMKTPPGAKEAAASPRAVLGGGKRQPVPRPDADRGKSTCEPLRDPRCSLLTSPHDPEALRARPDSASEPGISGFMQYPG